MAASLHIRPLPIMKEWLAEVENLTPAAPKVSGAQAVARARDADDRKVGWRAG